jgi:hypothetical protein
MKHGAAEFLLVDKDGKEVKVKTRAYNFEIEDVIKNRIGEEKFNGYQATGKLDFNFTLKDVETDYPQLLEGDLSNIDWRKQNFDALQEIYFFFVRYRKNASVRRLELEKEMLLSNLEMLETIILSLPENILQKLNLKRTSDN